MEETVLWSTVDMLIPSEDSYSICQIKAFFETNYSGSGFKNDVFLPAALSGRVLAVFLSYMMIVRKFRG